MDIKLGLIEDNRFRLDFFSLSYSLFAEWSEQSIKLKVSISCDAYDEKSYDTITLAIKDRKGVWVWQIDESRVEAEVSHCAEDFRALLSSEIITPYRASMFIEEELASDIMKSLLESIEKDFKECRSWYDCINMKSFEYVSRLQYGRRNFFIGDIGLTIK